VATAYGTPATLPISVVVVKFGCGSWASRNRTLRTSAEGRTFRHTRAECRPSPGIPKTLVREAVAQLGPTPCLPVDHGSELRSSCRVHHSDGPLLHVHVSPAGLKYWRTGRRMLRCKRNRVWNMSRPPVINMDLRDRPAEKQARRASDEAQLAAGEISSSEQRQGNSFFSGLSSSSFRLRGIGRRNFRSA
jgi:hypothetical protein